MTPAVSPGDWSRAAAIIAAVERLQERFVGETHPDDILDEALAVLRLLTNSQYGFIAETRTNDGGERDAELRAVANVAWGEGVTEADGQLPLPRRADVGVIADRLVNERDPIVLYGADAPGAVPAACFLGIPLVKGDDTLGVLGLGNRPGGYPPNLVGFIRPVLTTTVHIIATLRAEATRARRADEALRRARDEAVAAALAKSEFLANVRHEIRTPMKAVIGMTQLLLDTALDAEQRECVETIRQAGDSLLGISDDIRDECLPFDLRASIEQAGAKAQAEATVLAVFPDDRVDPQCLANLRALQDDAEDDFVAELIDHFVGDCPSRIDELAAAVAAADVRKVERTAHSLKSSCGNLGLVSLSAICRLIEHRAAGGALDGADDLVAQLRSEFATVRPWLEEERAA